MSYKNRQQHPLSKEKLSFWKARYEKDIYILKRAVLSYRMFNISENKWNVIEENILSQCEEYIRKGRW